MAEMSKDIIVRGFDLTRLVKQAKLPLIAVYNHPTDYPDKYVARVWDTNKPTRFVKLAETLEEIRDAIPKSMCNIGRKDNDDPCIVEVWI